MPISYQKVTKKLPEYNKIINLIKHAFPKVEQMSPRYLNLMAKRKCIHFDAYYDETIFIGFTYLVESKNMIFITYIAVNDEIRSKGYGSRIISTIKSRFPNKVISLNVERLIDDCDNYEQRFKRIKFYERNNFVLTDKFVSNGKEKFSIMATDKDFSIKDYRNTLKKYSFGLYAPKVTKE